MVRVAQNIHFIYYRMFRLKKNDFQKNTPGTAGGPGGRDRTLAVKSRKQHQKIISFSPIFLLKIIFFQPKYSIITSAYPDLQTILHMICVLSCTVSRNTNIVMVRVVQNLHFIYYKIFRLKKNDFQKKLQCFMMICLAANSICQLCDSNAGVGDSNLVFKG